MADQETLDSLTPPQSHHDPSHSHSASSSSSSPAPSLSTTLSSTRLNASAPEFVPVPPSLMIPPPPPPWFLHMYHHHLHPPPPFHVPITGPILIPPHERRRHRKKKDPAETGASVSIDPKTGLPQDTVQKIVNQVEYYFSDLNLATTDVLMRFMSNDPQGYVPLHVVASFNKIKSFIYSHSQLATVLQNSSKLVVSEDGNRVRRIDPITKNALEELQSRIVIAENLPGDHCYQNLMKIFSAVGSVNNIRTCQPRKSSYGFPSAARAARTDFRNKVYAYVEYESVELAEKAVAELNEERYWRSGRLRVRLMLQHQTKEATEKEFEDCGGEKDGHVQEQTVVGEEGQGDEKSKGRWNYHPSNNEMNNTDQVGMGKQQPPTGPSEH